MIDSDLAIVFIIKDFFASFFLNLALYFYSKMASDETTPLLPQKGEAKGRVRNWLSRAFNVENRILLAGFLITLSFSFTQVP